MKFVLALSNRDRGRLTSLASLVIGLTFSGCALRQPPTAGAVVVECDRGEAADVAGLEAGDLVVEWRQGRAAGAVESPFHLAMVEQELAPYGPVKLIVQRGAAQRRVVLASGRWRARCRPLLTEDVRVGHSVAQKWAEDGELARAAEQWSTLANRMADQERPFDTAWFRIQAGVALAMLDRHDDGLAMLADGAVAVEDPRVRAAFWERAGDALLGAGQVAVAGEAFTRAIALLQDDRPESPALAFALIQLCRTDLRACGGGAQRAAAIYRGIDDETIEYGQALNSGAAIAFLRSDLGAAEAGYQEALDVIRGVASDSPAECDVLGNLGLVALRRGDLDTARSLFREEMEIAGRLGFDTLQYAYAGNYLGLLAKNMGRYEEARVHYERALRAFKVNRPGGIEVAGVLTNLGNVALLESNLDAAQRHHEEALLLRQRLDPNSADVAASLHSVGLVAKWRGDLATARRSLEQALELKERFSPGSAWLANTLFELGEVARAEGNLDGAEDLQLRALEIHRRVAPRHPQVAIDLFALGALEQTRGRKDAAEELWREAIGIIEQQRRGMQITDEDRTRFASRYYSFYGRLAQLLVDDGRLVEAWDLLERARSGALRGVIARRDSAPAGTASELWFAKHRIGRDMARIEDRLARLDPVADQESLQRYRSRLSSAEAQLDEIEEEIRAAAPRYAAFSSPEATSFRDLQQLLDDGTAVLSYSLGEGHSMALVVVAASGGRPSIEAFPIPVGAEEILRRVNIFHSLIARGRTVTEVEPALVAQGRKLFELLVEPAFGAVAGAERVLIVPDGPLVDLPFAALVLPGDPIRFFGHAKPLFFDPSASVFAEIKELRQQRTGEAVTVAAFGDPQYSPHSAVTQQYRLHPLPGSRDEVESIERLFGSRVATFLGPAATESNLRVMGRRARVLHCAVHAVADPLFPMDSALFFTLPEDPTAPEEDGVLSAWEIVDTLAVEADVVVLSACGTARGEAVAGEGIIGLARAFQYAGARTLVVSQWAIPDRSTAQLMARHYEQLEDGSSTAEALQIAQRLTAASGPATAHPFHWASFQVRGDWR